jgi:hypothetical protein
VQLAVLFATILFMGCASGPGSSPNVVSPDFASKAAAVCQHAHELKLAQGAFPLPDFNPTRPDPTKFPTVAAFLRKTATTFETWLADMKELGAPLTGQAAWTDLVSAVERHVNLNADQIAAAERGDGATFSTDYSAGLQTQAEVLRAATAAGVPQCAQVDR